MSPGIGRLCRSERNSRAVDTFRTDQKHDRHPARRGVRRGDASARGGAKRRVGFGFGSDALVAESRQADICAYLAGTLLVGLLLNAVFSWWWADPAAALVMVPLIAYEGYQSVRGRSVCTDGCGLRAIDVKLDSDAAAASLDCRARP